MGCGQQVLQIIRLNTLVVVIRVPKVRTSSILLLVSVLFFVDFLVDTVKLKPIIKWKSQENWYQCISDVVIASVHSENTRLKKVIMIIIIISIRC